MTEMDRHYGHPTREKMVKALILAKGFRQPLVTDAKSRGETIVSRAAIPFRVLQGIVPY